MHFANTEAMTYGLLILVMIVAMVGYWIWKQRLKKQLGHLPMIEAMSDEHSARRQIASGVFVILGALCLLVALIQPQWGQTDRVIKRTGIDVVFALDLSRSMLARDVSPSRLQAAKNEIQTTLERLGGDRVGLVVFTAVSFAQSPLTTDYGAMRFYLKKLVPRQMPYGGTSVGRALDDSADLLLGKTEDDQGGDSPMKRAKNQIIVLITDGEDHESNPLQTAQHIGRQGIHIVTVGFGSEKGERIPVYRDDGTLTGYKRDREGKYVRTKLDESTLKKIATETGGIYIPYRGENSVAYGVLEYINQLEKTELEALMRQRYKERYMWFLLPGVLLLMLGFAIGDRRRPGRKRVGEGAAPPKVRALLEASKKSLILMMLLVCSLSLTGCEDTFRVVVAPVERGNTLLEEGDYPGAITAYKEAGEQGFDQPSLAYNLGRAHMGAKNWDEAQASFARALETQDKDLRFDTLYNLGLALSEQEKWQDAIDLFRDALLIYADNPEARTQKRYQDAVHNLEVAFNKLYPPCATLEDDREENDEPGAASQLEELKLEGRSLCGEDDDWYAVPVLPGTQVAVTATFKELRDVPLPEHRFLPRVEDLQIALFDISGERVLRVDQGQREDGKEVEVKTVMKKGSRASQETVRVIERFTVTPDMLPGGAPALLLKVSAADELEFSYDLDITAIPPCDALEDDFEDNDDSRSAKVLSEASNQLHICSGDEDWFSVEVGLGDTFFVDIQGQPDIEREVPPELSLEIFAPDGSRVAAGKPDGGVITAGVWEVNEPGVFKVRISGVGGDQQGPYKLDLFSFAPCPFGDDRFEENDAPGSETQLDAQVPVQRYLRICPEDADFYRMPLPDPDANKKQDPKTKTPDDMKPAEKKPRRLALGLSLVEPPAEVAIPLEEQRVDFELMSESGDQILLESKPYQPAPPSDASKSSGDKKKEEPENPASSMKIDRVLQTELDAESALIRVQGTQTFYHLIQLESPPSSSDQQQQDQQDQQDQQENEDQSENQDQEGDSENQEKDESSDEEQDSKGKDDGEEQEPEQEKEDEGKSEEEEDKEDEEGKGKPMNPQDAEVQRIEDILQALEESDDNFQMRKALENTPSRHIEKDW